MDNVIQVLEGLNAAADQPCLGCTAARDQALRGLGAPPIQPSTIFAALIVGGSLWLLMRGGRRRSNGLRGLGASRSSRAMGSAIPR